MKKAILLLLIPFLTFGQTQIGQDIDGAQPNAQLGTQMKMSDDATTLAIWEESGDKPTIEIYRNIGGNWESIGVISDNMDSNIIQFGLDLSSNGNIVAIGVRGTNGNGDNFGLVNIFQNNNNVWEQIGNSIIGEADEFFFSFGNSLSLSADGTIVAIGEPWNDDNGENFGQVRIYENNNNVWEQIGQNIDGASEEGFFGRRVSISSDGSILAIGARSNDNNVENSGQVRVFNNVNNSWVQIGDAINGEAEFDFFGENVSISSGGSIIAITASGSDEFLENSGQVRVFNNVNNSWVQIGDAINGEAENDFSGGLIGGVSISSDGSIVAIGAAGNDGNSIDTGHVRIYQEINGVWTQVGVDIDGESEEDFSGKAVSLSGDGGTVAITAPFNDGNGQGSGHVRVFDLSQILSTDTEVLEENISLLPNPASKNITISLIENQEVSLVNIYNNLGQLVQTETEATINISALATGSYYVQVTTDDGISTKKLLVE